jgi:tRNA modification GTPase
MNYTDEKETIAAISTPVGSGAISIVRLSGSDAFNIADRIFRFDGSVMQCADRKAILGHIVDNDKMIDEAILLKYTAPNSYTGENIIEIDCHGGKYVAARILETVISNGARPALPGEFTKRAFLNGKLDLIQAQAVSDLISAKSSKAGDTAIQNLEGRVSAEIKKIKEELTQILAEIEVMIDFPEYDIGESEDDKFVGRISKQITAIKKLIGSYKKGSIYTNGIRIVIAGRPNVGKSTFLNIFTGKNRAIVTDIPGTTRDIIEEHLDIDGIPVILTDTAGLRDTENIIEQMGQEKTKQAIHEADVILLMIDPKDDFGSEDEEVMKLCSGKHILVVLNKTDTVDETRLKELEKRIRHSCVARTSLISGTGMEDVERIIKELLEIDGGAETNEAIISDIRQKDLLSQAYECMSKSVLEIKRGIPSDITEIDIKRAAEYLGEILGENINEEITEKIFSGFCLGK